jgi:predicted nucleotidyltransferase component of viral defense system
VSRRTEGLARSVHTRLVDHAKEQGLDPTLVFTRYALERFLFRLGESPHADRFILKGAVLLFAWLGDVGRATRDVDFLGVGDPSDDTLVDLIVDACRHPVDDDGIVFDVDTIRVVDIRADQAYGGRRVTFVGLLGKGRIHVQVDVGTGDATVPEPEWIDLPTIFDGPAPKLRAYRPETVVAEKLHAIVHLGLANTRLKDFYDLIALSHTQTFEAHALRRAIEATFSRRRSDVPVAVPPGLGDEFADEDRQRQWSAFLERNELELRLGLDEALEQLGVFLGPVVWARDRRASMSRWTPGRGWDR